MLKNNFVLFQSELIISKGYPCEEYVVQTEDGFLLTLQRIPHGKSTNRTGRGLVFLQHGLLGASTNWIANMPSESLGELAARNIRSSLWDTSSVL